jgi:hypothetical protein
VQNVSLDVLWTKNQELQSTAARSPCCTGEKEAGTDQESTTMQFHKHMVNATVKESML